MIDTKRLRELATEAKDENDFAHDILGEECPDHILSLLDRIDQDEALMRRMLKTMEFIEGCNGVAVLDPIDRQEILDALSKRLEQS